MAKKRKSLKKPHLKPSALFYKMLIDRVLSFYFFHILGDVPFSKGIHRACFPIQFGKQAFLVYPFIFSELLSPYSATLNHRVNSKKCGI